MSYEPSYIRKSVRPDWHYIKTNGAAFFGRDLAEVKRRFKKWWQSAPEVISGK